MSLRALLDQHTHIGLDLDETLASTFSGMLKVAHSLGKLTHCESIESFTIHDIFLDPYFNVTREEMIAVWHEYGMRKTLPQDEEVVNRSQEWVLRLTQVGKECFIITARDGKDERKKKRTENWIQHHFPMLRLDRLHFVHHYSERAIPKSEICKNLWVTLVFDDHIDNAIDFVNNGIACILIERPWNRNIAFEHPLLYRVKDWHEIEEALS